MIKNIEMKKYIKEITKDSPYTWDVNKLCPTKAYITTSYLSDTEMFIMKNYEDEDSAGIIVKDAVFPEKTIFFGIYKDNDMPELCDYSSEEEAIKGAIRKTFQYFNYCY